MNNEYHGELNGQPTQPENPASLIFQAPDFSTLAQSASSELEDTPPTSAASKRRQRRSKAKEAQQPELAAESANQTAEGSSDDAGADSEEQAAAGKKKSGKKARSKKTDADAVAGDGKKKKKKDKKSSGKKKSAKKGGDDDAAEHGAGLDQGEDAAAEQQEQDAAEQAPVDQPLRRRPRRTEAAHDVNEDDAEVVSRRRRRRRRGEMDIELEGGAETDPPNTITRVRAPRSITETSGPTEVTSLKGSTRLEAKRQRRWESRESRRNRGISEAEFLARREAVDRQMMVRQNADRIQIAVLEDGVLAEHFVSHTTQDSLIGNVYLGKVQNVLPSMEAAFVDIGRARNAVLYAGEVNWDAAGLDGQPRKIENALKSGDSVLVQVTKDPVGHKGARLTSQVSLPGRYLVYVPNASMTGISRKLPESERARLKKILKDHTPEDAGVIVRTAAEGASEEELINDINRLHAKWSEIKAQAEAPKTLAPELLYSEPDLTIKVVRDVFNEDFSAMVIQGEQAWDNIEAYVTYVAPDLLPRLQKWEAEEDIFAGHRIDEQLIKALDRKVFLPSGGSLVFDRTEAMTVVDVNTGKFTGSGGNLEETVTKNNLEAAEEIARQLRLRDIGGIIVIDFIDMVLESNRDLVLRRLVECLGRDRTKHQVAEVTSLGLVQMTRKRMGTGLIEVFSESCTHCAGRGIITHDEPLQKSNSYNSQGQPQQERNNSRSAKAERRRKQREKNQENNAQAAEAAKNAERSADEAQQEEHAKRVEETRAAMASIAAASAEKAVNKVAAEHAEGEDAVISVVLDGENIPLPRAQQGQQNATGDRENAQGGGTEVKRRRQRRTPALDELAAAIDEAIDASSDPANNGGSTDTGERAGNGGTDAANTAAEAGSKDAAAQRQRQNWSQDRNQDQPAGTKRSRRNRRNADKSAQTDHSAQADQSAGTAETAEVAQPAQPIQAEQRSETGERVKQRGRNRGRARQRADYDATAAAAAAAGMITPEIKAEETADVSVQHYEQAAAVTRRRRHRPATQTSTEAASEPVIFGVGVSAEQLGEE